MSTQQRKEIQVEQRLSVPPDNWYAGVGVRPQDKNFRPQRPFLALVYARGTPFLMLAGGAVERSYGMWCHLGGALDFLPKTPERKEQLEEHATTVLQLSGFKPKQIVDHGTELRDMYRLADTFPFPVEWTERRKLLSQPQNSWYIGFCADGEVLVRPRTGWMRRSHTREFIAAWYATQLLLRGIRNVSDGRREMFLKLQEDLGQAVEEITGLTMEQIERGRLALEDQLRAKILVDNLNVREGLSPEELKQEDIFGTRNG